jgi:parvulin-like peptidyl-prolyl isomerase
MELEQSERSEDKSPIYRGRDIKENKMQGTQIKTIVCLSACVVIAGLCGCKKGIAVATIGNNTITLKTLEQRIMDAPPAYQSYLGTQAGRKQFLDLLVREQVVIEGAKKSGVNKLEEYKRMVADYKKDQAKKFKEYQDSLMMELYVRQLHDKEIGVSEQEIEKYFTEHKDEFLHPLEVTAKHILVPTRALADKVLARVKSGEDFSKIAKEVSTDPISAARGGEIGPFRRGDLVPEFEKAVFPLKIGEVSGIVETQFGFHVIKKISQKALPARMLEEAKPELRKYLEKSKFDAWFQSAKDKLNVKVDYSMLSQLPPPAMSQPQQMGGAAMGPGPRRRK